jgi:predicted nucleic acid-binding protein
MKSVVDSCVWIAYASLRDRDHDSAVRIVEDFLDDESQNFYLTDYIVLEVTNFLLRKTNPKIAFGMMELVREHERISMEFVDEELFEEVSALAKQLKTSLTDASLVSLMKRTGIKTIYSFDSGFDKIKGLERRNG